VAAPVVEELVFRALAQRLLNRVTGSPVFSIVLASLAFTATHSPWTTQPPVFVLSLFLGWLYFRSGTILAPMLMHAIFNGVMFTLFLLTSGSPAVPTP
jgi:membrane protease YdiL (CAAX protease family)